jgi:predicted DNA-binding protein (MmcQ/YjbR family)
MAPHCPHPTINPSDNPAPRRVSRASQGVGRAELIVSDLVPQRDRLATREGACDRLEQASVSGVGPEELKSVCLSFAGAREEFPFDEANSVFKVVGKIFALSRLNGVPLRISLKCDPGLAIQLRTSYASITGGYHLNKRHWNTVVLDGSVPDQLLCDMIEDS